MELMSSLLLCALAAMLPQALGVKTRVTSEIKRDSTKIIETPISRKTVLFSEKIPSMMTVQMLYQAMMSDEECSICARCMKKSIFAFTNKNNSKNSARYLSNGDAQNDIIDNYQQHETYRQKRDAEKPAHTVSGQVTKSTNFNTTVTEYSTNGQVYAIQVRGNNSVHGYQQSESCHVYGVKKHYPCDAPKAKLMFAAAQNRANKVKNQIKSTLATSKPQTEEKEETIFPKGLTEPFMTSIEELYK